ncbi:MAG: VWA domain-containing protein [Planctomycetes bacterium]|nr:VWA domain-containing protein [Planctomycetota bacterium]
MKPPVVLFRVVVAALCLTAVMSAQEPPSPNEPPQPVEATGAPVGEDPAVAGPVDEAAARVARAIADYDSVPEDAAKEPMRRQLLLWLGDIDHPAATDYLVARLEKAGDGAFAATVCEALGRVPRPALLPRLRDVLVRRSATTELRTAAAAALLRWGDEAVEALFALATGDGKDVPPIGRDVALQAIASSGRAPLQQRLVDLLSVGEMPARLRILRSLEDVTGVPALTNVRVALLREGPLEMAAVAWRQLTVDRPERGRQLAVDLIERFVEPPTVQVAADLIGGLARCRDADFYPLLLRYGSMRGGLVRRALRDAAKSVAEDPALVRWLIEHGLDSEVPVEREAAVSLLIQAPPEAIKPLVDRLRTGLRAGRKKAIEQAAGLHELLVKDPTWRLDLAAMASSNDLEARMLGLSMLLELGAADGVLVAQQSLVHRAWELRSLSIRYLTRHRDATSVPLLIARYGKEDGRLGVELDEALFVHTGTRCFSKRDWDRWWQKHKTGFVLPHADSVRANAAAGAGSGKTVSYHDIPVVSSRIAFLVDRSGSMRAPIGTDRKYTRLDAAKEQLNQVVSALPKTTRFNVVVYESAVVPFWKELQPCSDEVRKDAIERTKQIALGGGTNIFDALEQAFADPEVDTIYLLTDGEPTAGRIVDREQIVEEIVRQNSTRQVVVHCIGLGIDSDLLKQLAAATGGSYRYVR